MVGHVCTRVSTFFFKLHSCTACYNIMGSTAHTHTCKYGKHWIHALQEMDGDMWNVECGMWNGLTSSVHRFEYPSHSVICCHGHKESHAKENSTHKQQEDSNNYIPCFTTTTTNHRHGNKRS